MRAVLSLVWLRLRYRPARWLLVALGMAGATVLPVLAENSSTIVAARALRHGIEALPAGQRSLIVSYDALALSGSDLAAVDRQVRTRLSALADRPARRQMLFRRFADTAGGSFSLGAADDLAGAVRVTSGRAPASCRPERCEVVVVGEGTPRLDPALGLVVVGRAVRTDPLLLAGTFDPGNDAPLLLADGVEPASGLAALTSFRRAYGWVTPVDLDRVQHLGVARYLVGSGRTSDELTRWRAGLVLTSPDDVLRAEDARARRSSRRFALLAGAALALLLAFAAIGAIGLRRDHAAVLELLRMRGARAPAIGLLTAAQSAAPVAGGTAVGVVTGGLAAWVRAAGAGLPGWASARAAIAAAWVIVAIGALASTAVVAVTLAARGGASARVVRRAIELTVLAGVGTAVLAVARGSVTAGDVDVRTDPVLLALPVIAVVCGGLATARIWPALATTVARLLPHGWLGLRLGLLGALRRPLRPVATVAFLTAAAAIVVFAGAYRATLRQGAADQAAFAVPLDARITVGRSLERPLDVASADGFAATAPGVTVHPVVRAAAGVRVSAAESTAAEVIGVDPDALTRMRSWEPDVGAPAAADAARRIAVPRGADAGTVVPAGTRVITFPASGDVDRAAVTVWLRTGDGREIGLALRPEAAGLAAVLPAPLRAPARLYALVLTEPPDYATHHQHRIGEGRTDVAVLSGTVTLAAPRFTGGGSAAEAAWTGWGSTGAQVTATAGRLTVSFQFTGARVVVAASAAAPAPIPVLADPATAALARGGILQLTIGGTGTVAVRVARVVPRFPTTGARFVVADVHALADALDATEPGTGSVSELWLWAPEASTAAMARALAAAPYDRLVVDLRQVRQQRLTSDPVAAGAVSLLDLSALLAVLVGLVTVVLLVVAERRDESAELYAWEGDGVAPRTLRISLFGRAAAVVIGALPAGLLVGLALSRVTVALVQVTAVGTAPMPPLALAVGPAWITGVLAAGMAAGLAVAALVAATALREALPRRPEDVGS